MPGQVALSVSLPFVVGQVVWSPDASWLVAGAFDGLSAVSEVGGLARVDVATGQIRWQIDAGRVGALAVSPDGSKVAVSLTVGPTVGNSLLGGVGAGIAGVSPPPPSSSRIRLLDAVSAEPLWEKPGLGAIQLAFSPDGRSLVVNGRVLVRLLDAASGAERHNLDPAGEAPGMWIVPVAFSPDSARLVVANRARVVLFATATGNQDVAVALSKRVVRVAFTEDGRRVLAVCGEDATITVIDAASGVVEPTVPMETTGYIRTPSYFFMKVPPPIAVSPDGRRVGANCSTGFAVFRSDDGRAAFPARPMALPWDSSALDFSPAARQVATTMALSEHVDKRALVVVNPESGGALWSDDNEGVIALAFSPNGRRLAGGGQTMAGRIGNLRVYESDPEHARCAHQAPVVGVAIATSGLRLVASASADHKANLFQADSGDLLVERVHPGPLTSIAFTPDAQHFVTASTDGNVRVFETVSGSPAWHTSHGGAVSMIAVSPRTGGWIATASADRTARVLRTTTGEEMWRHTHPQSVSHVAVSGDESRVATGCGDRKTRVLDAATGQELHSVRGDGKVRGLAFGATVPILATANDDGSVTVLDAATAEQLGHVVHVRAATAVAISRQVTANQGPLIATAGLEKTVRITTVRSGTLALLQEVPVTAPVTMLAFHPILRRLAILQEDGTVRIIDPIEGVEHARLIHPEAVRALAFDANGELVVTACADGIAYVFTIGTPQ
jgi:WD40 repeat protein